MIKKQFIEVQTDFEAIHNWPECPFNDVSFLKYPHRHKIFIVVKIQTGKDREQEFFRFKWHVDSIIEDLFGKERIKLLGRRSMEEISNMILNILLQHYKKCNITVSASEDNQVRGIVEYEC